MLTAGNRTLAQEIALDTTHETSTTEHQLGNCHWYCLSKDIYCGVVAETNVELTSKSGGLSTAHRGANRIHPSKFDVYPRLVPNSSRIAES